VNRAQSRDWCAVSQAGELLQSLLGGGRQAAQLADHEIHHIVGETLGTDAVQVPGPAGGAGVERQQPFLGQRGDKLDREERISAGFLVHQLRQGPSVLRPAMQGVVDESANIVEPERGQDNLLDP
jgi:hypothetical protein